MNTPKTPNGIGSNDMFPPASNRNQNHDEGVLDQAKHAAQKVIGQTKDQLGTQLKTQKDEATDRLGDVANALRQTGKSLDADKLGPLPSYANQAADQVERVSSYFRSRTIGELIGDVEGFARREPAIFLGGSFALGLIAARFLKSSAHHDATPSSDVGMDAYKTMGSGGSSTGSR